MAKTKTIAERCDALDLAIAEDRVTWGAWDRGEKDGRRVACLLAHLAPECIEYQHASACPADVLPGWFAYLTPWMDDEVSDEYRPVFWREYARVVRRSAVLTADDWRRLDYAAREIATAEAKAQRVATTVAALEAAAAAAEGVQVVAAREAAKVATNAASWAVSQPGEIWAEMRTPDAWAAAHAAADRITRAILAAIDAACAAREGQ
jgi:hypothetical protein